MTPPHQRGAWQLTPLDLAVGHPTGFDSSLVLPEARHRSAREAFEAVVLEGLLRAPCVVSFSGGRDSSAVLATAVHVARREGLPLPVAVSQRFAGVASSEETAWQERVVASFASGTDAGGAGRAPEWEVLDVTGELDLVGQRARAEVERHGVLWPPNTHFHSLIAERAAGGSVLTGFGGDEIMSPGWAWDRLAWVLARQVRPRPSDLAALAVAAAPGPLRARYLARRPDPTPPSPWLRPGAERTALEDRRAMVVAEPVHHGEALRRVWWPSRYRATVSESLRLLGTGYDTRVLHPFADARVVAALAAERGRSGPRSRTREMTRLFSDLLPPETVRRVGKATFNGAFFGEASREFVRGWSGEGLQGLEHLVDVDGLRRTWATADPDARTYTLLQHVRAVTAPT